MMSLAADSAKLQRKIFWKLFVYGMPKWYGNAYGFQAFKDETHLDRWHRYKIFRKHFEGQTSFQNFYIIDADTLNK